jgi:hypothetical protein
VGGVVKIETWFLESSFVLAFGGVCYFGMWFVVFWECVYLVFGFVFGPIVVPCVSVVV